MRRNFGTHAFRIVLAFALGLPSFLFFRPPAEDGLAHAQDFGFTFSQTTNPRNVNISVNRGVVGAQTLIFSDPSFTPTHIAVGDFDGDGRSDLVVLGDLASQPGLLILGLGDGTFGTSLQRSFGDFRGPLAVGDI